MMWTWATTPSADVTNTYNCDLVAVSECDEGLFLLQRSAQVVDPVPLQRTVPHNPVRRCKLRCLLSLENKSTKTKRQPNNSTKQPADTLKHCIPFATQQGTRHPPTRHLGACIQTGALCSWRQAGCGRGGATRAANESLYHGALPLELSFVLLLQVLGQDSQSTLTCQHQGRQ